MPEAQKQHEKLFGAALEATADTGIEALFRVGRPYMAAFLETPWRQRPWVLSDSSVKCAPLRKVFAVTLRAISLDWPDSKIRFTPAEVAAEERSRTVRDSGKRHVNSGLEQLSYYFGPPQSAAAGLLVASLPRSKARVMSLLCVTRDELMLLHVPDTCRPKHFANAVDIGWRIDRNRLEWTRKCSDEKGTPNIQYGFTDGSWMTLYTHHIDCQPAFTDLFPHTLTKEDPIPPNANYPEPEPEK